MREVSGAVIAIVLVLCAVFIPVAFLGGIAGKALPAVRRHRGGGRGDLGHRRADPDARLCACCSSRPTRRSPLPGLSTGCSALHPRYQRGRPDPAPRHHRRPVLHPRIAGAGGLLRIVPGSFVPPEGPGLPFSVSSPLTDGASAKRTSVAAEQMRQRIMSDDVENIFLHQRHRLHHRQQPPSSVAYHLHHLQTVGAAQSPRGEMAGKFMGIGMNTGRHGPGLQSASHPGPGYGRRLRGLCQEPCRRRRAIWQP